MMTRTSFLSGALSGKIKAMVLAAFLLFSMGIQQTGACEIDFEVLEGEKQVYHSGDELILKVKVIFTHRICPEGIGATKFEYEGMKILGATKWQEVKPGIWERKLKVQMLENDQENIKLTAIRTCDKTGGMGNLDL